MFIKATNITAIAIGLAATFFVTKSALAQVSVLAENQGAGGLRNIVVDESNVYGMDSGSLTSDSTNNLRGSPITPVLVDSPTPPVANPATLVASNSFTANWRSVIGATGYRLDVAANSSFTNYVTGYQNLNVGNVTSRSVTGLNPSTTYYYRVRAYDGTGTSGNSNTISVSTLTPTGAPVAITNPASLIASFSTTLNGTVDPHGLTTTVYFQYGTTTQYGSSTTTQTQTGNTYRNITATIRGLMANTAYHFRIVAVNSAGTRYGNDRSFTTLTASGAPVVITGSAANVTSSSARLNGALDPHGLITSVYFQYGPTTSYGHSTAVQSQTGNAYRNIAANISSLTSHTTYHFRIVATNSAGTRMGSDRTFTTSTATHTPTPTPTATRTPSPTPTCTPGGMPGPWIQAAPVAVGHYGGFIDSNGTYAYEGGGYSFQTSDNINQFGRYDPATNTWAALASVPDLNNVMASGVYAPNVNKFFVFGGQRLNSATVVNTTRIYNIATNTWSTGANMPGARIFMGSGYYNGKIYLVGGYNSGNVDPSFGQVWEYDPVANTWNTSRANMPITMGGPGFGIINGHIYIAGGRNLSSDNLNTLYDYDIAANTWTQRANLLMGISVPGSAVIAGKLWIFGGGNPFVGSSALSQSNQKGVFAPDTTNLLQIYDPATNTWTVGPALNQQRSFPAGTHMANTALAVGGYTGTTTTTSVEINFTTSGCGPDADDNRAETETRPAMPSPTPTPFPPAD